MMMKSMMKSVIVFAFVAVMAGIRDVFAVKVSADAWVAQPVTRNMLRGGVITRILQLDTLYCLDTRGKCVACESYDCSLECTTCDDVEKDKKDKKDKTKKNKEVYYGCVCEGRESMNVFEHGFYYGQMVFSSISSIGSFIESVEPTNVEDVPPCECISDDIERIPLVDAGTDFKGFEEYYLDDCISQCLGYPLFYPVIFGGTEYGCDCYTQ